MHCKPGSEGVIPHVSNHDDVTRTYDRDNPCLFRDGFRAPRKVAGFETESTEFEVTTTGTDGVNALRTELGVSGLATEFELPLLAVVGALRTGFRAFVS